MGTGGRLSKRLDLLKRQEEVRFREDEARREGPRAQAIRDMQEAEGRMRRLLLTPHGAYLNLPELHHLLGNSAGVERLWAEAVRERVVYDGVGHECVRAQEVERLADSGRCGVGVMGKLEIFQIERLEDWSGDVLTLLGFRRMEGVGAGRHDVTFWFAECRRLAITARGIAPGGTCDWRLNNLDWVCHEGDVSKGPVGTPLEVVPVEVAWHHTGGWYGGNIYYIRTLKGACPEPKAESEGSSRTVAASGMPEIEANLDDDKKG